jgi:hypothetical protein
MLILAGQTGRLPIRLGLKLVLLPLVACAAVFLPAATAQSSPVFGVNWHFSLVKKHYSARVGEFLATGEGTLDFNQSPLVDEFTPADSASGTVAVEYQQLKPHATAMIRFTVVPTSEFRELQEEFEHAAPKLVGETVRVGLRVTASNSAACKVGSTAVLYLIERFDLKQNVVVLSVAGGCRFVVSQKAAFGSNSRIRVIINGRCLRVPQSVEPLCGGASGPEQLTVTQGAPVTSKTVLVASHKYRLDVSGTVSYWCPKNDPTTCFWPAALPPPAPPHPSVELSGVDALYCYAAWRCPTPELWRPLQVNGMGLDQFAGLEGKIPYNGGHTYTVTVTGVSGTLSFADAASTPTGSFTVTITDLGTS